MKRQSLGVLLSFAMLASLAAFAERVSEDTTITLTANSGTAYEIDDGITLTIEVASGYTCVLSGQISGSGTLRKTGLGTLALSYDGNVIPGGIDIAEGTVRADAAGALGSGELRIVHGQTPQGSVSFNAPGATFGNNITVTGTNKSGYYAVCAPVSTTLTGLIVASASGIRFENASGSTLTIDGELSAGSKSVYLRTLAGGAYVLNGKITTGKFELGSNYAASGNVYINNPENVISYLQTQVPVIHCGDDNVMRGAYWSILAAAQRTSGTQILHLHGHDQTLSYLDAPSYNAGTANANSTFITSDEQPCTLTLTGTSSEKTSAHKLNGGVSLDLNPTSAKFVQVFTDCDTIGTATIHTTTGTVTITKGTLRITGSTTSFSGVPQVTVNPNATLDIATSGQTVFSAAPRFVVGGTLKVGADALSPFSTDESVWYSPVTLAENASLEIDNGTIQRFSVVRAVVNGETVKLEEDTYTYPDDRVPQLKAGSFIVMGPKPATAATWTGGGANTGIATDGNWSEDGFNLDSGYMSATFASGGNTATVSSAVVLSNIVLCAASGESGFAFSKSAEDATVTTIGDTLQITDTDATSRTYSFAMPFVVEGSQTLSVTVPASKTLSFLDGIQAENGAVAFSGSGTVNIAGECVLPGELSVPAGMAMNISGSATVLSGVTRLSVEGALSLAADSGFPFPAGTALALGESAAFAANGETVPRFASVTAVVNGEEVSLETGAYSYPDVRVPQLTAGSFAVTAGSATWTGEGEDDAISNASNWDEAYIDVLGGSMSATFATGGNRAVVSSPVKFNDVTFSAAEGESGFTVAAGSEDASVALTGNSLTVASIDTTRREYTFEPPVTVEGSQTLAVSLPPHNTLSFLNGLSAADGAVAFSAPGISSTPSGQQSIVNLSGKSTVLGSVSIQSLMALKVTGLVEAPGGQDQGLAVKAGPQTINIPGSSTSTSPKRGLILSNATISKPVCIAGNGSASNKYLLYALAGTTNTISGNLLFSTQDGSCSIVLEKDAELTCSGGVRTPNNRQFNVDGDSGSRVIFTEKPVTNIGEYVNGSSTRFFGQRIIRGHEVFDVCGNAIDLFCVGMDDTSGYSSTLEFRRSDMFSSYPTTLSSGYKRDIDLLVPHTRATSQTVEFNSTTQRFARVLSWKTTTFRGNEGSLLEIYGAQEPDSPSATHVHVTDDNLYVAAKFEGSISLKMCGTGTLLLTNAVSSTSGGIEVTGGTVKIASNAAWTNAAYVAVGGSGRLEVEAAEGESGRLDKFGQETAVFLSGNGVVSIPNGTVIKVADVFIDGVSVPAGRYSYASAPEPLKSHLADTTGVILSGKPGMVIFLR